MQISLDGISIDVTCLLQMGNFLIAYGMLRCFLFKPVYKIIVAERRVEQDLQEAIASGKKLVANDEVELRAVWYACHAYFMQNRPCLEYDASASQLLTPPELQYPLYDEQTIQLLTDQVATQLMHHVGGTDV